MSLPPGPRAAFATCSRLISCLVTESLVHAIYLPLHFTQQPTGLAVLLTGDTKENLLALVPLKHVPVFKHDGSDPRGREIGLLDPMDMMPVVYEVDKGTTTDDDLAKVLLSKLSASGWSIPSLVVSTDPLSIWHKFAKSFNVEEGMIESIAEEFDSSVRWQQYSFEHPPRLPTWSDPSVVWEQSIVQGHPTHPMHKTRMYLPPMPPISPGSYDLYHPLLRLIAIPKANLDITYDFEGLTAPIREAAAQAAGKPLDIPEDHLVIPVHELQIAHIEDKFREAVIYPKEFNVPLEAQQSIRSVILPESVYSLSESAETPALSLKLAVGIKLTSAVRTISPASAYLGPRFSSQVVPHLTFDRKILTVARELASVVYKTSEERGIDGEIAKHGAAIVREAWEVGSEKRRGGGGGERLIVCTSLVESGHAGVKEGEEDVAAVIKLFGLDTEEKRIQWLDQFIHLFFQAFLPSVLTNGVAFEAHPQNCVARFELEEPHRLLGFIIRDFGGIRVHPPTLFSSTSSSSSPSSGGVKLDAYTDHSIIAPSLEDVYTRMYHTVIHNHLQQLIRVLGLHYNGIGWGLVRKRLGEVVPREHALWETWLGEEMKTLEGKCFLRMRMQGMYRFHLHGPFPNLIHYRGVEEELRKTEVKHNGNGNVKV